MKEVAKGGKPQGHWITLHSGMHIWIGGGKPDFGKHPSKLKAASVVKAKAEKAKEPIKQKAKALAAIKQKKTSAVHAKSKQDVLQAKAKKAAAKHGLSESEALDRIKKGKPLTGLSEKAIRAQQNQSKTTGEIQTYTKANEFRLAQRVGGKAFPDNDPADVHLEINGKARGIELKTVTHGKNDKITMKGDALSRKDNWENQNKRQMDTVVLDHRDKFNPELHSGHEIYYKRGVGAFRIGSMHKVNDEAELKKLMAMPYDQLPKAAQGPIRGWKDDQPVSHAK